jgi:hypothetical protein
LPLGSVVSEVGAVPTGNGEPEISVSAPLDAVMA